MLFVLHYLRNYNRAVVATPNWSRVTKQKIYNERQINKLMMIHDIFMRFFFLASNRICTVDFFNTLNTHIVKKI